MKSEWRPLPGLLNWKSPPVTLVRIISYAHDSTNMQGEAPTPNIRGAYFGDPNSSAHFMGRSLSDAHLCGDLEAAIAHKEDEALVHLARCN